MPRQISTGEKLWYVLHTYSGYEDSVVHNLKQRIESMGMEDKIFDVIVPKEKKIKIRDGKRVTVEEKIFPGYVLVNMIVTDDSWYVVRNTPNVTGFVGSGTVPSPISEDEVKVIQKRMGVEEPKYKVDVIIGDAVKIRREFHGLGGDPISVFQRNSGYALRNRVEASRGVIGCPRPA